ncbi:hypothetical protein ACFOLA_00840 [Salinicoccus hispanicus]|uniref:Uncharacterized protein n=1 Tax=Salinicoccus hispanicus TaxID=157225 RepID=A0A6N8U374_9STAP|nr:hypothetical protein [Salinicoccus hispanicus]MXQ50129.1 hypothetical protein [Salinicoccus hispanicus]
MSITIKRSTNFIGIALPLNIKIDGRKVEKVYHEEEKEIEIERPMVELSVSQFLSKSTKITVAEGDYIEVRSSLWRSISMIIFFILLFVITLGIQTEPYKVLAVSGFVVYAFIAERAFEQFRLEKVEFEEERRF